MWEVLPVSAVGLKSPISHQKVTLCFFSCRGESSQKEITLCVTHISFLRQYSRVWGALKLIFYSAYQLNNTHTMHHLICVSYFYVTHTNSKYSYPLLVTAMFPLIPLLTHPILWLFRQRHSESYIWVELLVEKTPWQQSLLLHFQDEQNCYLTSYQFHSHLITECRQTCGCEVSHISTSGYL